MATVANFSVDVGTTFSFSITYIDDQIPPNPINLLSATAKMQVRRSTNEAGKALLEITNVANSNGSVINLAGTEGIIYVLITDEDTSKINVKSGFYDLVVTLSSGEVDRIVQGVLTFPARVTI